MKINWFLIIILMVGAFLVLDTCKNENVISELTTVGAPLKVAPDGYAYVATGNRDWWCAVYLNYLDPMTHEKLCVRSSQYRLSDPNTVYTVKTRGTFIGYPNSWFYGISRKPFRLKQIPKAGWFTTIESDIRKLLVPGSVFRGD